MMVVMSLICSFDVGILFMQATNSLICNLLDIVEEVQMAQIEIENLVQANFHSPSGTEKLY